MVRITTPVHIYTLSPNHESIFKNTTLLQTLVNSLQGNSGKIVKEVTETTTLRVSHDTRLGIASYKVISNTLQGHQENVDVKEIRDLERIVSPDVHGKTNGLPHETELGSKSESLVSVFSFLDIFRTAKNRGIFQLTRTAAETSCQRKATTPIV